MTRNEPESGGMREEELRQEVNSERITQVVDNQLEKRRITPLPETVREATKPRTRFKKK